MERNRKPGPTPTPIDADAVYELARSGCSQREAARVVGCHQATISRRFAALFTAAKAAREAEGAQR